MNLPKNTQNVKEKSKPFEQTNELKHMKMICNEINPLYSLIWGLRVSEIRITRQFQTFIICRNHILTPTLPFMLHKTNVRSNIQPFSNYHFHYRKKESRRKKKVRAGMWKCV